jgi:hypothetical protein
MASEKNGCDHRRQKMKRSFRITVAIFASILFFATGVAHACIGTTAPHDMHDHGGVQAVGPFVQTSHAEAQDENCRSVRDRFVSSVPRSSETDSLLCNLDMVPTMGEQAVTAIQMFTAERPPGIHLIADNQSPLYIFNSVFRI